MRIVNNNNNFKNNHFHINETNIIIIGAGPAGISVATQLFRYKLLPTLVEKDGMGGLLRNANLVENYPGFPNGISGPDLISLFKRQMERVGLDVIQGEVTRLDFDNNEFSATVMSNSNPNLYRARIAVIATGTKAKPFPVFVPQKARGQVFSEVWPLFGKQNKHIVIVGAGDAAFDYALNLAARDNTVTILNRGTEPSCLPLLWERIKSIPSITYQTNISLQKIEVDKRTNSLILLTDRCSIFMDYCIFAIGREPAMDFLTERVKMQEQRLVEDGKLYLIGDVHNGIYRQTGIAVGEGLRAAMQIYQQLSSGGLKVE